MSAIEASSVGVKTMGRFVKDIGIWHPSPWIMND